LDAIRLPFPKVKIAAAIVAIVTENES